MLSSADEDYRVGKFTGSLANAVMNCKSEAELVKIWRVKIGLDPPEPENWAMRAGAHMESLILDWVSQTAHSPITRRGEIVDHELVSDICVKLDGYRAADDAIIEVKFLAPWRNKEEFLPAHYAQTMLQRLCARTRNAVLVVAQGTSEPVEYELEFDQDYADELMRRTAAFLQSMRTLTPPFPEPPIVPRDKWRTVDVIAEPTNWSTQMLDHLTDYGETAVAAQLHVDAGQAARDLVPDDVGKCLAGVWQITRNRKGVLAITRRAA
jgi:hypothetical protein